MKKINLVAAAFAGATMLLPLTATAGSNYKSNQTCRTASGKLCPPKLKEKIVPEYYKVPTKTQHIYYQKPVTQPVVTRIIHHVPVPVYGGKQIHETIQAGPWTGPSFGCCQPKPKQRKVYCNTRHKPRPSCR